MEFRPVNGRFPMVPRLQPVRVALGNATAYTVCLVPFQHHGGIGETFESVFVAIEDRGAYQFSHWVHWGYLKEKLGLKYEGDARNFADFLNDQFGWRGERQGEYRD